MFSASINSLSTLYCAFRELQAIVSVRLFVAKNVGFASWLRLIRRRLSGDIRATALLPFCSIPSILVAILYSKSVIVHIYWISGNFTIEESVFRWNLLILLSKFISVFAFSAMNA